MSSCSIFALNCTEDKTTLWGGDLTNRDGWGAYLLIDQVIDTWVKTWNLKKSKTVTQTVLLGGLNLPSQRTTWVSGKHRFVVIHHKVIGGSHNWPMLIAGMPTWEAISEFFLTQN